MKQFQYSPMNVAEMAVTLFAVNRGFMDDIEVKRTLAFEAALQSFMKGKYAAIMDKIQSTGDLDGETEKQLSAAIEDFKAVAAY
jgi:F-type H+-transporting ATPase subunit alpha